MTEQAIYIKQLEEALTDVVDGEGVQDIVDNTGLSLTRSTEIYDLSKSIISGGNRKEDSK